MLSKTLITTLLDLLFVAEGAVAEAPLKGKVGLDTDQAKVVAEIQSSRDVNVLEN